MRKEDVLSTLFVGIDVGSRTNAVCAIDFFEEHRIDFEVSNDLRGAAVLVEKVAEFAKPLQSKFNGMVIAMESTSVYGFHIATYLSTAEALLPFHQEVYCLNPVMTASHKKQYIGVGKTDPIDAHIVADSVPTAFPLAGTRQVARINIHKFKPWRGSQFLALQRLTRHRLHIADNIAREKSYMLNNIFLKFSGLATAAKDEHPFSNKFGATAEAVLREFMSTDDIIAKAPQELADFVNEKGHKHFADPERTAELLRMAASNSYRLDKCLYEPLTISIASSFNCVSAFEKEIKTIDKAIIRAIKGLNTNEYQCFLSIPGIGSVYAAGIPQAFFAKNAKNVRATPRGNRNNQKLQERRLGC